MGAVTIRTWRERVGVTPEYPLDFATPVERAMVDEIADLRAEIDRLMGGKQGGAEPTVDPRQIGLFAGDAPGGV